MWYTPGPGPWGPGMELGNNKNVMPVTLWSSTSSNSISVLPSWKFTSEYAFDKVLAYELETYTNSHFQISSYNQDFEATQIRYQVWCAASEAWSLCGSYGSIIRSKPQASTQNSTRLTGKLWHAKGTMTLLPLSVTPPFEVASDTSAAQMWRGFQGEETTLT